LILSACVGSLLLSAGPTFADNYVFTDRNADAYVLTKDYVSYSTNATGDDILNLNQMFGGNYLWVRRGGKEFVIRDAHAIKDANRLFAALDEVEPERAALQQENSQLKEEESSLNTEKADIESRLAALDKGDKAAGASASLEGQLAELAVRRSTLADRTSDLEMREEALATRVRSLQLQVETSLWALVDRALADGLGQDSSRW
jgi:HD-GYP domain-containing protein (c-di-GMP phosphodiesterase class II)